MNELQIIKSAKFGETTYDIYGSENEFYMTREQIGSALEYANPRQAIGNIHERKKERLDKYSVVLKLRTTDGKTYDTTVYNRKGIMEICRHSGQPKADDFMDWAWDTIDSLISGRMKVTSASDKTIDREIRMKNVRVREASILLKVASADDTEPTYRKILKAKAVEVVSGERLLPYPAVTEKTYTAAEVAEMHGISSANMVGKICNTLNLKAPEGQSNKYGHWIHSKSQHSVKEVKQWLYTELGAQTVGDYHNGKAKAV